MIDTENNFVQGNLARKIEYNVYEENEVLKAKRKQRSNNKAKFKLVLSVFVIFSIIFIIIYRYALITELNYNIDKSMRACNELKNENSILRVDIEKETDLSKIRQTAEEKLGMHKPDKFQVIYVNVPKSDYSIVSQKYDSSGINADLFGMISDKLGKLTNLIY